MIASELIQILMRDENIDKEILVVDVVTDDEYEIEDVKDVGRAVKIVVDLSITLDDRDCTCDCDLCRHCLES